MPSRQSEYQIQAAFIRYIELMYPDMLYTISPAGFIMSPGMARKMMAMGYTKGTPDVMIFEPRGNQHGFFIEFKAQGGKTSESQDIFLASLRSRNYHIAVCFSTAAAIQVLESYLNPPL